MARRIGPTIGLSGEAEYKKQIKDITAAMSVLDAQMNKTTAAFANNEKSTEALTAKNKILAEQNRLLGEEYKLAREQVEKIAQAKGKDSAATKNAEKVLIDLRTQIIKNNNSIKENTEAMQENSKELEESSEKVNFWSMESQNAFNAAKDVINGVVNALKSAISATYEFASSAGEEVERLQEMANEAGTTVQRIQELQYASSALNIDVNAVTSSMRDLSEKAMDAVKNATGETAQVFSSLGVHILDINGNVKDSNVLWEETMAALGNVHNETERTAAAMKLFGGNASKLNSIMGQDGVRALRAYSLEANNAGVVMDEATRNALQRLNDEQEIASQKMAALKARLAAELAPELTKLIQYGVKLIETFEPVITKGLKLLIENLDKVIIGVGLVAAGFVALQVAAAVAPMIALMNTTLTGTAVSLTAVNAALLTNPITWIVTGIVAGVGALVWAIASWTSETEKASDSIADGAKNMEKSMNEVNEVAEKFNEEMKALADDMDWTSLEAKFKAKFSIIGTNSAATLKTGLENGLKDWENRLTKIISGVEDRINSLMTQENKTVYAGYTPQQNYGDNYSDSRGYKSASSIPSASLQPVEINLSVDKTKLATVIYDPLKRVARQKGEA